MDLSWINENSGALSVIFSFLAVAVAVFIPVTIAHNQKKISLYEERLKILMEIDFIRDYCDSLLEHNVYKQYEDDPTKLKPYLFSEWVICLRTKYPDAWEITYESIPSKGEILFKGDRKAVEQICEMHLCQQYSTLRRCKYVFGKDISADIISLSKAYYEVITDINKSIFYSWERNQIIDINKLLQKYREFQESNNLKKINKMIKL